MTFDEVYREEVDGRGISHLVVRRTGRCATFQDCAHEVCENLEEVQ